MGESVGIFEPVRSPSDFKTLRLHEIGSFLYMGYAGIGATEGSAVWQIKRLTDDGLGNMKIEWADGNAEFDNVWTNHESLTYS